MKSNTERPLSWHAVNVASKLQPGSGLRSINGDIPEIVQHRKSGFVVPERDVHALGER